MAFEFQNPGPSSIKHVLHRPFGCVPIGCGEYVPTAEQEAQGLTAEFFEDLVSEKVVTPSTISGTNDTAGSRIVGVRHHDMFRGCMRPSSRSSPEFTP